jgi:PAS domain S-box-containing protein
MQRFESLVQSIGGIIIELDPHTFGVTFVSRAAERILGYPLERWLDEPNFWEDLLHPEDRATVLEAKRRAVAARAGGNFEYRMIAADGRVVWLRDVMTLRVTRGGAERLCGVQVDITERKRAEEGLRRQKEILQNIFDHIPVMVSFFDEEGRLVLANREWERVGGLTLEEVRERDVDVIAEGYPDSRERQRVLDFIAESSGEWEDFRTRMRDGRVIDTSWAAVRLSDGTRLTIGQDVTERKRAEAQLRANAERLRALSASLATAREEEATRIAREIHDELGGALTGLRWDLESLARDFSDPSKSPRPEVARERLEAMLRQTDATVGALRRITQELRPSVLDDLGLAAALEWQAQQFQTRTGIECNCDCPLEDLDLTEAQATAVFRIFQESLTNILRHARADRVDISMRLESGKFVLTVRDNGRGITEQQRAGQNTLGLLGMRERARLVGGEVEIEGVKGRGTTVTVRLPVRDEAEE